MAKLWNRLSTAKVNALKAPGTYHDGGGLYLQVAPTGSKSWFFRYMINGRSRKMGLGPTHVVGLLEARTMAGDARKAKYYKTDPLTTRQTAQNSNHSKRVKAATFRDCASHYIDANRASWKNAKHGQQWENTLEAYAYGLIGNKSVEEIDTNDVLLVLEPIWATKPETASRVRGRIEAILASAKVRGLRAGDNPASWQGNLDQILPRKSKVAAVGHHAALPYADLPAFMDRLSSQSGQAARALELCILTASRTNEILGATWSEIDLDAKAWTIPASRMKGGKEHKIPLTTFALKVLTQGAHKSSDFIFSSGRKGTPLSNMAMLSLLKRMGQTEITVHGFRSCFRDWAAEETEFQSEVIEMCLAHAIDNKVEAAYRRGDLFEKRSRVMKLWDKYACQKL